MTSETLTCEDIYDGEDCTRRAAWLIQVGSRRTDAQTSCPQHLSRTCQVMIDAENRNDVTLSLTRLGMTA